MAEKKSKLMDKIVDALAAIVTAHDKFQIRFDDGVIAAGKLIVSGAAKTVEGYDTMFLYVDRGILILSYHIANFVHERRHDINAKKKTILTYFAGAVLVAIGVVSMLNYATAYEYAYNGKTLGYVKNQDDVYKILAIASDQLSKEYGSNIDINPKSDISFHRVVSVDKDIDDVDTVLKRLTYMQNVQSDGYGIYIDGKQYVAVTNKSAANQVINTIKAKYTQHKDQTDYEEVGFVENVKLKKVSVKLTQIRSVSSAVELIDSGVQKQETYTAVEGDTYYGICDKLGITLEELKENNPQITEETLHIGEEFVVQKAVSALNVKTVEKSTFAEAVPYDTEYKDSSDMYVGDSTVAQAGEDGKRVVTAKITRVNGTETARKVLKAETLRPATDQIIIRGTAERPKTAPTGSFRNPLSSGYSLTSPFGYRWGRMHEGVDMACATGTPIYAADGGTVKFAGTSGGYGLVVTITHGNGKATVYGHCSAIDVAVGDKVYKGQKIAAVGNTGRSTGSHLHFEIQIDGTPVNPLDYI